MDSLVQVAIEVGKGSWGPIRRHFGYLVHYKEHIESLKKKVEDLEAKKTDFEELVRRNEENLEEPTQEVRKWLADASKLIEVTKRIEDKVREEKRWLKGFIPDWSTRYTISKEATERKSEIQELLDRKIVEVCTKVSRPLPSSSVIPFPCDGIIRSTATERALKDVMEALENENINSIGVYGMGGIGKTTLMKVLNNKLQTVRLFDKVIMVTVSSKPDFRTIQNEIAQRLGLKLDSDSPSDRANKLRLRLEKKGAVLVILDDLWERLELSDVGIPLEKKSDPKRCCKIIITTRSQRVCHLMQTQSIFEMTLLTDAESWILFKEKAGDVVDSPPLKTLAEQVMRECNGLPLAINAVGLTLRMVDDSSIWKAALSSLRRSVPSDLEGELVPSMIKSLRFSYDYLKHEDAKKCFLFCSLFPEDHIIDLSFLLGYGIGEGFLDIDEGVDEATYRVCALFKRLRDCGLLLEGRDKSSVKMHDVVRDVAGEIARQDGHGFMVKARVGLEEWPLGTTLVHGSEKIISLMWNDIKELPKNEITYPNLRTLLLQGNKKLENISSDFFNSMPSLVVLDLSYTNIRSLPSSLSHLVKLRTLCLNYCRNLEDISLVGKLKSLLVLTSHHSVVRKLPTTFDESSCLKILVLSESGEVGPISSGIMSKFSRLEILQMRAIRRYGRFWTGLDDFWIEAACLSSLTELSVDSVCGEYRLFKDALVRDVCWPKLKRFFISLFTTVKAQLEYWSRRGWLDGVIAERRMHLGLGSCNPPPLANWVNVLLEKTQALHLEGHRGLKSAEQLEVVAFSTSLGWLNMEGCSEMECFIDLTRTRDRLSSLFPNLRELSLYDMTKMSKICHGGLSAPAHHEQSSQNADHDHHSPELVTIADRDNIGDGVKRKEDTKGLPTSYLGCRIDRYMFERRIEDNLMTIDLDTGSWDNYEDQPSMVGHDCLSKAPSPQVFAQLQKLGIYSCKMLRNLFTMHFALTCLNLLRHIEVVNCESMVELIGGDQEKLVDEDSNSSAMIHNYYQGKGILPRLEALHMKDLPSVKCFYPMNNIHFNFQSLYKISIHGCPDLKELPFHANTAPNLERFECDAQWFEELNWKDKGIKSRLSRIRKRKEGKWFKSGR